MKVWPKFLNICLVEDNEDLNRFIQTWLESRGHLVYSTKDVQEALLTLATRTVDIIICDIGLPDGNGWDLMRLAYARNCAPIGIAISGFSGPDFEEKSLRAGFQFHLSKPFDHMQLDEVLIKAAQYGVDYRRPTDPADIGNTAA
ncbi:MAG: response regulator [Chthoniobacterales bacterium]